MVYFLTTMWDVSSVNFICFTNGRGSLLSSILVNSMEWSKISPNLAWLVDAGGCMLLDIFNKQYLEQSEILILLQFFQYWRHRNVEGFRIFQGAMYVNESSSLPFRDFFQSDLIPSSFVDSASLH
ncbi:hypothetical protein DVH24_035014 [Malus domestica]|uniref:Uncharacterized protein n=1 Tax=Malus domestica TaxID=3750 RepID=A0A498IK06_MALDO|nr:hypothetical protein DVH24_035014 [Malus domestica]